MNFCGLFSKVRALVTCLITNLTNDCLFIE
jgi:hypothetical protein